MLEQTSLVETVKVCVEIGRLMLSNGGETYRVEDTIYRIGESMGLVSVNIFAVPTAIMMTAEGQDGNNHTEIIRVSERNTNLEVVTLVNNLSRRLVNNPMSPNEVRVELYRIKLENNTFAPWMTYLGAACTTGAFPLLFGGTFMDILPAFIAGGAGQMLADYIEDITNVSFFAEVMGGLVIGLISTLLVTVGLGENLNPIIVGSVMTLVPGVAITNGFRDLMAGHLLAGISILANAVLTATAIGIGVAVVLAFL